MRSPRMPSSSSSTRRAATIPYAMKAVARADTLVTPINDSFVDLDLIGQVDPDTFKIKRPSFYAELVWDARKARAKTDGGTVDWVVLRNRLQHLEARNMRRVGAAVDELSKRVGFRVIPGLGERVIYRELFPKGLTLLDLGAIKEAGLSHVAARQELREMVSGLQLPEPRRPVQPPGARRHAPDRGPTPPMKIHRRARASSPASGGSASAVGERRPRCRPRRRATCSASSSRARRDRDPRRAPPADRPRPSRCGRLGRARRPRQCRARPARRRIAPGRLSSFCNRRPAHATLPATINGEPALTHRFDPTSLREYDIRGIVGKALGPADAHRDRSRLRARECAAPAARASRSAMTAAPIRRCSRPR